METLDWFQDPAHSKEFDLLRNGKIVGWITARDGGTYSIQRIWPKSMDDYGTFWPEFSSLEAAKAALMILTS